MDITAFKASHFQLTLDLTSWASVYALDTARFILLVRPESEDVNLLFAWDTLVAPGAFSGGVATYESGTKRFTAVAPSSDIARCFPDAGSFRFHFGFFLAAAPADFIRVEGGAFNLAPLDDGSAGSPSFPGDTAIQGTSSSVAIPLGALLAANNLGDLPSASEARTNLGAGTASGLATLDGDGKLPAGQLPTINAETIANASAIGRTLLKAANASAVMAALPDFIGDEGTGGTAGRVPAPPAGSGAKLYRLAASGIFVPSSRHQLLSQSFSAVAGIALDDSIINADFDEYEIRFEDLIASVNASTLFAYLYVDGDFQSSGYLSSGLQVLGGISFSFTNTSGFQLTLANSLRSAGGISGEIRLYRTNGAATKKLKADLTGTIVNSGTTYGARAMIGGEWNLSGSPVRGLQLAVPSANVTAKVEVFGIK